MSGFVMIGTALVPLPNISSGVGSEDVYNEMVRDARRFAIGLALLVLVPTLSLLAFLGYNVWHDYGTDTKAAVQVELVNVEIKGYVKPARKVYRFELRYPGGQTTWHDADEVNVDQCFGFKSGAQYVWLHKHTYTNVSAPPRYWTSGARTFCLPG